MSQRDNDGIKGNSDFLTYKASLYEIFPKWKNKASFMPTANNSLSVQFP
jgi:hypothetical protein